jgi:hypothetical protein
MSSKSMWKAWKGNFVGSVYTLRWFEIKWHSCIVTWDCNKNYINKICWYLNSNQCFEIPWLLCYKKWERGINHLLLQHITHCAWEGKIFCSWNHSWCTRRFQGHKKMDSSILETIYELDFQNDNNCNKYVSWLLETTRARHKFQSYLPLHVTWMVNNEKTRVENISKF